MLPRCAWSAASHGGRFLPWGGPAAKKMKALDRKLLRDLRRMWSQALTIALVVASGLGGFITTL